MSALAAVPTKMLRGSEQPEPEEDGGMQEGPDTMCYRGLLRSSCTPVSDALSGPLWMRC